MVNERGELQCPYRAPRKYSTLSTSDVDDLKIVFISYAPPVFHLLQSLGGFSAPRQLAFPTAKLKLTDTHPVLREATTNIIVK